MQCEGTAADKAFPEPDGVAVAAGVGVGVAVPAQGGSATAAAAATLGRIPLKPGLGSFDKNCFADWLLELAAVGVGGVDGEGVDGTV